MILTEENHKLSFLFEAITVVHCGVLIIPETEQSLHIIFYDREMGGL